MALVKYSKALAKRILKEIEKGGNIREICRAPGMPSPWTVHSWRHKDHLKVDKDKTFADAFITSEDIRLSQDEESVRIEANEDGYEYLKEKLGREPNQLEVRSDEARRRRKIDTLKFTISKQVAARTKRLEIEHKGLVSHGININVLNYEEKDSSNIIDLQPEELKLIEEDE